MTVAKWISFFAMAQNLNYPQPGAAAQALTGTLTGAIALAGAVAAGVMVVTETNQNLRTDNARLTTEKTELLDRVAKAEKAKKEAVRQFKAMEGQRDTLVIQKAELVGVKRQFEDARLKNERLTLEKLQKTNALTATEAELTQKTTAWGIQKGQLLAQIANRPTEEQYRGACESRDVAVAKAKKLEREARNRAAIAEYNACAVSKVVKLKAEMAQLKQALNQEKAAKDQLKQTLAQEKAAKAQVTHQLLDTQEELQVEKHKKRKAQRRASDHYVKNRRQQELRKDILGDFSHVIATGGDLGDLDQVVDKVTTFKLCPHK